VEEADVRVSSLAHGGDGVGRLADGRTVFVNGGCPGDLARVRIREDHDRWARGDAVELIEPSPDRVEPPCPYFGACGGCQWQHIAYGHQTAAKHAILTETLRRIGHLEDPGVEDTVPSPAHYGYRNKVELSAVAQPRGLALGFTRMGTAELMAVDACLLLPQQQQGLPKALAGALRFLASRGATGIVRASIRASSAGEVAVDVWTLAGPFPRAAAARVVADSTGARTVTRVIVRGAPERREIAQVEILAGPPVWHETLAGDHYVVSAPSFFQVNTAAAIRLRSLVADMVGADGSTRVADLYAGVGTFTLPLARSGGATVAVEASRWALSDLKRNLDRAGLSAEIVPGDAAHALPTLGHLDTVLMDPPRSGLSDATMRALAENRAGRLVYVSCDPATLARDVARLRDAGYTPVRFVPVDLFPQTYHLETVALLERS